MSEKEKLPWGLKQTAPGSMKALSKDKLEAFDQGTLYNKKHLSKKELEELKKKSEDQAAAELLKDFEASFDEKKAMAKMFVKGSTINPSTKEEKPASDKGNLYAPALKLMNRSNTASPSQPKPPSASAKSKDSADLEAIAALTEQERAKKKRKSNLESFKEELKRMQLEREERNRKRQQGSKEEYQDLPSKKSADQVSDGANNEQLDSSQDSSTNSISNPKSSLGPTSVEDPTTTNIFISNLSPKTNEQDLMHRFGKYGLLGSVKIMWPRTDEEKARNANCGFVAFMNRRDAELALRELDGCVEHGQTMRLSWSKAITVPSQPIYIPPELIDIIMPPPPSGLPFNAQPQDAIKLKEFQRKLKRKKRRRRRHSNSSSGSRSSSRSSSNSSSRSRSSSSDERNTSIDSKNSDFNKTLQNALVKVVIPTDRNLLCLIHRMIEFVIKEGPAFEAMIMSKEINNPMFRFLYDNQSPAHGYYRWKLFSLINGDSASKWKTTPFKMFDSGSYWIPPPINRYTQGCNDEAYEKARQEFEDRKGKLTNDKKEKFEEILKNLTTERKSISDAMIFCIENAEKAQEIVEILSKSISPDSELSLNKIIARLYLLSDILHNCIVKVSNAHYYRKGFEKFLPTIFDNLNKIFHSIDGKMKSESFKQKTLNCIRAWEDWTIYPNEFLVNLQNRFLGLVNNNNNNNNTDNKKEAAGNGDEDEDVDGKPLDGSDEEDENDDESFPNKRHDTSDDEDDSIDGKPLDESEMMESESEAGKKASESGEKKKFVSSQWETVDPEKLKKQAITTSKWDFFDE